MSESCYIGIDTSNYTTSVAIVTEAGEVAENLKAPLPVRAGECGLRQSDAVFAHTRNLPLLMAQLKEKLRGRRPLAVGVSAKPRDEEGSYMPCFLSGVAAAETLAAGLNIPVYAFSHQAGHIMAALYGAGAAGDLADKPFFAFHVSGGTTDLLLVTPQDCGFHIEQRGGSADLHAGQAIDRIGVMMGLSFPCGPALEQLAAQNEKRIPPPKISVKGGICHLSGLENLAKKLYLETEDPALVAAFTQQFIAKTLASMTASLRREQGELPVVFAGGVMSNRAIAQYLGERFGRIYFSDPAFAADNAAGIALLCRRAALCNL